MDDRTPAGPPILSYATPTAARRERFNFWQAGGYIWLFCWAVIFVLDWCYDGFAPAGIWVYPIVFIGGFVCVRYGSRKLWRV